ncbi:thioredoxin fold domain-containing protein [Pseudodesulfovibrio cashew]|uniref:Thioredoxin fold domain-containing protein n=1 Tax=Pseudodesulfovibrio cashew TaxID=2678688 RepID=A0A6I6JH78_9BACT|nr:TlpA disulfide reductase family protein [Pseudodesulfovibrio cashew]QGY39863.1 thioredoxin fold domain-containing protein [Pseudodesulfovibrio cashew]
MNYFKRLAALSALLLLLIACSGGAPEETEASSAPPESPAERFPAMDVAQLDNYLTANKGKPTMLIFWATWCPSCKQAIPEMEKLAQSHGDKVNVITVSVDERRELLTRYFQDKEQPLPVYWGGEDLVRKFGVEAIPTLVLFNKSGEPVFSRPGAFPYSMLTAMADKLNAE